MHKSAPIPQPLIQILLQKSKKLDFNRGYRSTMLKPSNKNLLQAGSRFGSIMRRRRRVSRWALQPF